MSNYGKQKCTMTLFAVRLVEDSKILITM